MKTTIQLSEHFTLKEFENSAVAQAHGIDNTVPVQYIPTLQQLCHTVLEPLRDFAGVPIIISSGYRCNELNVKVGGVYCGGADYHTEVLWQYARSNTFESFLLLV